MSQRFAQLAFTPAVQQEQTMHNSRAQYERAAHSGDAGDRLGPDEREFIATRDGFYMATVSETGWPYIQYRGGQKGFLRVLDDRTLGFADLRGNRQYITTGNLRGNDRVALFLMDYPTQSRLKILGRVEMREETREAEDWIAKLRVPAEPTPPERAFVIHVEAFDWNCQQHITPRYTQEEVAELVAPMRRRMEALEREVARLRGGAQ